MTSRAIPPPQAPPALRIPTIDSMKRLSTATSTLSDMADFNVDTSNENRLSLPAYVLEQIDFGRGLETDTRYSEQNDHEINQAAHRLDSRRYDPQDETGTACLDEEDIHPAFRSQGVDTSGLIATRVSSLAVPFNRSRPISQLSSATEGITALPTFPSCGFSHRPRDIVDCSIPVTTADEQVRNTHKCNHSLSFSQPFKHLRKFSLSSIGNKLQKKQRSKTSISCTDDGVSRPGQSRTKEQTRDTYSQPVNPGSASSGNAPATPNSKASVGITQTPSRSIHTLSTTFVPSYPRSSPIQSRSLPKSPAASLLPASTDLSALPALQSLISTLNTENQLLKEQVKVLREDWYATHDELLIERYSGLKKERELELGCEGYTLSNGHPVAENFLMDGQAAMQKESTDLRETEEGVNDEIHAASGETEISDTADSSRDQQISVKDQSQDIRPYEDDVWMRNEQSILDFGDEMVGIAR